MDWYCEINAGIYRAVLMISVLVPQVYSITEGRCVMQLYPSCSLAACCAGKCPCPNNVSPSHPMCFQASMTSPSFGAPGQPCNFRNSARYCEGNALCVKDWCVCPTNMVLSGSNCVEFVGYSHPGQSCAIPGTICKGGSTCSGKICKCDPKSVVRNLQCIPIGFRGIAPPSFIFTFIPAAPPVTTPSPFVSILRPGAACDTSCNVRQCARRCGGGSACASGVCTCPAGTYDFLGTCTPLSADTASERPRLTTPSQYARPGERCDVSIRCTGGSTCVIGTCTCSDGYQPSYDRSSCVLASMPAAQRSYPSAICTKNHQCGKNFTCSNGKCVCLSGYALVNGKCLNTTTLPELGSPCTNRCSSGASCVNGYCVCADGSITNTSGYCVSAHANLNSSILPGSPCDSKSMACHGGSKCMDGFCVCPDALLSEHGGVCKRSKKASARCESYKDCASPRVCSSRNTCDCPFTMKEDIKGTCRNRNASVGAGSSCHRGEQCEPGASCMNTICVCDRGPTVAGVRCTNPTRNHRGLHDYGIPESLQTNASLLQPCPQNASCSLPSCFCTRSGTAPPGGLSTAETPQMIILSFHGPITDRAMKMYKLLFNGKHRNPNGCAIKGTFFISHQWNNYDQTQWLYGQGHETAVNSMTHQPLFNETKERWRHEMAGMMDALESFGNVDRAMVVGVRAPQLLLGGDEQFEMMKKQGFLYDNSMPVKEGPLWPQTLDYALAWSCSGQNCPQRKYPGIWVFPLQLLQANDGVWHNTARAAIKPTETRSSANQFLRRNFYRNYNTNRAPFILTADSEFLTHLPDNGVALAVDDWLNEVLKREDVYVVTMRQAMSWMQQPLSSKNLASYKPWQCDRHGQNHLQPCETSSICSYPSSVVSQAHSFRVCGSCPKSYPWLGDPLGRRS